MRMAQELFRQPDPASVAELQRRFLREYTDALLQGGPMPIAMIRMSG